MLKGTEALREVEEMFLHPNYDFVKGVLRHDIAMIILKGRLQFSSAIIPICLFESKASVENLFNMKFIVLGFGHDVSGQPSRYLNYGQMSVMSHDDCTDAFYVFARLRRESSFCAGSIDKVVTCQGDSGGEILIK